jgi:hypothetical protein
MNNDYPNACGRCDRSDGSKSAAKRRSVPVSPLPFGVEEQVVIGGLRFFPMLEIVQ